MTGIKRYVEESVDELLNKVSWPTASELQNSAIVVLVATIIIALIIFAMDFTFKNVMEMIYGT